MARESEQRGRLFERVQDRFCASINMWCSKNRNVSFLSYDYQRCKNTNGQSREDALRARWDDIYYSVTQQGRAVSFMSEDADITNDDMQYDYQGKQILVVGDMDGLFVPINILYKTAFLNPGMSDVHPINLQDFLSGREHVFSSLSSGKCPSFAILDKGKPIIGFAAPSLCSKITISAEEKIEFSTGSISPLALAFRDRYGTVPTREFVPLSDNQAELHFDEPEVKDALWEAIRDGVFRFHGSYKGSMNEKGSFQMPQEWFDICDMEDLCMFHDQIKGEICVVFDDVLPEQVKLDEVYKGIAQKFDPDQRHNIISFLNPYPRINAFKRASPKGRVQINPTLFNSAGRDRVFDENPFAIELEGFGNGFTIRRSDGGWKRRQKSQNRADKLDVLKALSLAPILKHVKNHHQSLLQHEVELIITAHLSSRVRSLTDLGFGVSLGAPLLKSTEPS